MFVRLISILVCHSHVELVLELLLDSEIDNLIKQFDLEPIPSDCLPCDIARRHFLE